MPEDAPEPAGSPNPPVAVVTGASRGIGRAIAISLGEAGYTVYVSGRSRGPEENTIDRAAADVSAAGGAGVPVACDHDDDTQVAALFAQVAGEQGRLDVLANNVFPVEMEMGRGDGAFYDAPIEEIDRYLSVGLRTHYKATWHAVQIMRTQQAPAGRAGLVVNVTSAGAVYSVVTPGYCITKAALDKFTIDAARELKPLGIAMTSLWPGPLVGTETVHTHLPERRHEITESPFLTGRVVAALARDPEVMRLTGRILVAADVAAALGLLDGDGSQPPYPFDDEQIRRQLLRRAPLRMLPS